MKKYKYLGKSVITFSHDGREFLVHGEGPHELPEEHPSVKSIFKQGLLIVADEQEPTTDKSKR